MYIAKYSEMNKRTEEQISNGGKSPIRKNLSDAEIEDSLAMAGIRVPVVKRKAKKQVG